MFAPRLAAAAAVLIVSASIAVRGDGTHGPQGSAAAVFPPGDRPALLARAFSEIDALFRTFAETGRVPGIAYGILIDGQLVHVGAAGQRDLTAKSPVDADTVFRIASMTKSFTAMAILRLRDEGRLSLDDPAERYVPELSALAYPTSDSPRITIRHLLTHAEGFPEDNPWGDRQLAATDADMTRMMASGIPFSTPPGTAYEYSNFGFAILGRIVARAAGMPYARYVSSRILEPLGMTATTLEPGDVPADRLAHGYRWEDGAWVEEPQAADGAFGAMGGMLTSTRDLARYVGFLMSAWPPRDDPDTGPIRRSSAREMQQVWRPAPAAVTRDRVDAPVRLTAGGYGYGLRVWQTCAYPHVVAHSGGLPGFGSHMRWLPDYGVAVIAMGSLTYTSWARVVDDAIEALARTGGLVPRQPVASPALVEAQHAVSQLLVAWDDARARVIGTDNLFLDQSIDRRRASFGDLRKRHGACRPGPLVPENALRGSWAMTCERGSVRLAITLSPTVPPRVQSIDATSALPLDDRLARIVALVSDTVAAPEGWPALRARLDERADAAAVQTQLDALAVWGTCGKGVVLESDGSTAALVRWTCARGELDASVAIDHARGDITRLVIRPARGRACAQ